MKKAASIFLLCCFLFNIIGYKLFFYLQVLDANARLQTKIENLHETDKSLITVKIPIRLPYQTDWKEFESVEGEMTYDNITYKYVKRKVLRDTLILLCVNFKEKSQIQKNSSDFFKKVNDLTTDSSKKQVLKQSKDDFFQQSKVLLSALYPTEIPEFYHSFKSTIPSGYKTSVELPPSA